MNKVVAVLLIIVLMSIALSVIMIDAHVALATQLCICGIAGGCVGLASVVGPDR